MSKIKLIEEYKDTKTKCTFGKYKNLPYEKSIMYSKDNEKFNQIIEPKYDTIIKVINGLVLDVTEQYIKMGEKNIMVLNLASPYKAGGGVENGAVAQEEDIFRKTNYFLTLTRNFYPIPEGNVIYSDKVYIIKNNTYLDIDEPHCVSMLAAAAIKNPELVIIDIKNQIMK